MANIAAKAPPPTLFKNKLKCKSLDPQREALDTTQSSLGAVSRLMLWGAKGSLLMPPAEIYGNMLGFIQGGYLLHSQLK
jgi:hypothetical protein